jgi:predicted SpoU family rRNA methylase
MKLDNDLFPTNMNMVKLKGKKVMVRPSQVEPAKGKKVIIGEERKLRMVKPKSLEVCRWKRNEGNKPQSRPKATFDILMDKYREGRADIKEYENRTIRFGKPKHMVSMDQVGSSAAGNSSNGK